MNEDECFDIEKREGCACPRFQSPLELAVLALEKAREDLGREARSVWKPLTIRLEEMEGPHRKYNYLR
jgi:hypothetical protein